MPNPMQILKSNVAGARPPAGTRPGELYVNFADGILGYVDDAGNNIDYEMGGVTVSDTPPAAPDNGELWFDSNSGQLFVSYNDGSSQQWVIAVNSGGGGGGSGGIGEAPQDGTPYSRQDADWVPATSGSGGAYLPLAGGDLTGPVTGPDATFTEAHFGDGVVGVPVIINATSGSPLRIDGSDLTARGIAGLTNGVLRWALILGGENNGTGGELGDGSGSDFAINSYNDAGITNTRPPLTIYRQSGMTSLAARLDLNGKDAAPVVVPTAHSTSTVITLNKTISGSANSITGRTGSLSRWQIAVGNGTAETGGSLGSDFNIQGFNDAGTVSPWVAMGIRRDTGQTTFSMPILETSDVATKTNVSPVEAALDIVNRLTGVFYNQYDNPKRQVGLIAQDTQDVLPEVVFQAPPVTNEDGETTEGLLGVAYGSLVAVLVEAVKELAAKVEALEMAR